MSSNGVPPAELRSVIEKTAEFLSKHPECEEMLLSKPRLAFMHDDNEFHGFYKQRLQAYQSNAAREEQAKKDIDQADSVAKEREMKEEQEKKAKAEERKALLKRLLNATDEDLAQEDDEIKPPPKPTYILTIPYDLTVMDYDIIKLTAQFVARNGPQFHVGLMNRETRNPQFDFLKHSHPHNPFFNSMVECYTKCLLPERNIYFKLRNAPDAPPEQSVPDKQRRSKLKKHIVHDLLNRVQWERLQKENEKNKEDVEAEERAMRSQIDWHDFVVVETITFDDEDSMVPGEPEQQNEPEEEDMEVDQEMEIDEVEPEIKVRKDYVPAYARQQSRKSQKCPICGQDVLLDKLEEHIRIELLDPRFAAEKKAMMEKQGISSLASGDDIFQSLKGLAKSRTDIFGAEERGMGVTGEKEDAKKADSTIWDGHTSSISQTSNAAAASKLSIQAQIEAIHKQKAQEESSPASRAPIPGRPPAGAPPYGLPPNHPMHPHMQQQQQQQRMQGLLPRPGGAPPPSMGGPPPSMGGPPPSMGAPPPSMGAPHPSMGGPPAVQPPAQQAAPSVLAQKRDAASVGVSEPAAKKQKTAADLLVPEDEWLKTHSGDVTVSIVCAEYENKQGWELNGQTLTITIPITALVSELKAKITEQVKIPGNKQKLKPGELPVLRDKSSLASYNFKSGTTVQLSVKERGGRKR